ncbi:Transcription factor AP-2 alpha [Aphelenchoides avenae]|nr:Transcription factor AP-2 alpha [Aphelenchus avenae]
MNEMPFLGDLSLNMNPSQFGVSAFGAYGYGGMPGQSSAMFGAYFGGTPATNVVPSADSASDTPDNKENVRQDLTATSSNESSGSDSENQHSATSTSFNSTFSGGYGNHFGAGFMPNPLAQSSPLTPYGLCGMPSASQWNPPQPALQPVPTSGGTLTDISNSSFGVNALAPFSGANPAPWYSTPVAPPSACALPSGAVTPASGHAGDDADDDESEDERDASTAGPRDVTHDDSGIQEPEWKTPYVSKMHSHRGPPYAVHGRLVLLNNNATPAFMVTKEELLRRIGNPEKLNVSIIGAYLRRAKSKNGGKTFVNELKAAGVSVTPGARKQIPANSFMALCEGEAWKLANDYSKISREHFPIDTCAKRLLAQTPGTPDMKYNMFAQALFLTEQFSTILASDRSPGSENGERSPQPVLDQPTQAGLNDFSLRTHGFGVAAHFTATTSLANVLRYALHLIQAESAALYQQPFFNPAAFRRTMP